MFFNRKQNEAYPNLTDEECNFRRKNNKIVYASLKKNNDFSEIVRPIEHFIYFENENDRDACQEELTRQNYAIGLTAEGIGIIVSVDSKIDTKIVDDQVLKLCNVAAVFNGDYDGWETSICRK